MGREIKRVPLDFRWPLEKRWGGYLTPEKFSEVDCPAGCHLGYSPTAERVHKQWYGHIPFHPEENGSTPLTNSDPAVRAFAERNVANAPDFYGRDEFAIMREATRLARLWNGMLSHHLNQGDVDAMIADDCLHDLTHEFVRTDEFRGWRKLDPAPEITAKMVNDWSLRSIGSPGLGTMIDRVCEREGVSSACASCEGYGSIEAYPGQRAEAEAWEREEPPTGEGWQLWETVSEGSPISPVFPDAEGLAQWLTTPAACWGAMSSPMTLENARKFVGVGWAPSAVLSAAGLQDGPTYVAETASD